MQGRKQIKNMCECTCLPACVCRKENIAAVDNNRTASLCCLMESLMQPERGFKFDSKDDEHVRGRPCGQTACTLCVLRSVHVRQCA